MKVIFQGAQLKFSLSSRSGASLMLKIKKLAGLQPDKTGLSQKGYSRGADFLVLEVAAEIPTGARDSNRKFFQRQ